MSDVTNVFIVVWIIVSSTFLIWVQTKRNLIKIVLEDYQQRLSDWASSLEDSK